MLVSHRHRVLDAAHIGLERLSCTIGIPFSRDSQGHKVISLIMLLEVRPPGNRPAIGSAASCDSNHPE